MYAQHFGLRQDPFSIAPDPRYLFMSERHREALAHLLFGVSGSDGGGTGGGFVLLTGEIGTGKTTVCRCFLEQIPASCHVAYIFNPKLTVSELLESICEEFSVRVDHAASSPPSVKDYIDALNAFLLDSHAGGQSSVLVIDEAQNLAPEVLEQLRLLTNLETNERKLLQIVLIGQPELRSMLARPELEQLAQRVIARFHLDALDPAETIQYVEHRLAVAGLTGPTPFDRGSLERVHRVTGGVPRRINLLCGRAMLGAWAHGLHRVDRKVVNRAAREIFDERAPSGHFAARRLPAFALAAMLVLTVGTVAVYLFWPRDGQGPSVVESDAPTTASQAAASKTPEIVAAAPAATASSLAPSDAPGSVAALAEGAARDAAPPSASAQPGASAAFDDAEAVLLRLPGDMRVAWRELASLWNVQIPEGEPCSAAATEHLLCYRAENMTLPALRQLGRPGILTLQGGHGAPVYAVLAGLGEQSGIFKMPDGLHEVRNASLAHVWRGDFATYWRPPPGYSPDLPDGATGPAIVHLASMLDMLEGNTGPASGPKRPVLDATLRDRVRAFQRVQGLKPDGQPGPMTFMQLESAAGTSQPRLQSGSR